MSDSSDPSRPSRKPPTIDLKATVVDDGRERAAPDAETPPAEPAPGETSGEEAPRPEAAADEAQTAEAREEGLLEGAPAEDPAAPRPAAHDVSAMSAASPPREAGSRGAGFGSLAAAGLLGGLVGAGAILAYDLSRPAPASSDPRVAELQQQVAALPRPDTAALDRRIGALEAAQNGLAQRVQAAQQAAERALARAEEAASRPAPQAPASPAPAAVPQAVAPQTPAAAANPAASEAAVAELRNRLGALEGEIRSVREAAGAERQALRQGIDAAGAATRGFETRLGALDARVGSLAGEIAQRGTEAGRAQARVALATRVDAALRDGAPYADALQSLRQAGADAGRLAALEPYAGGGAPSAASLARDFETVRRRLDAAAATPTAGPGAAPASGAWTDRVLGLLDGVVTIRPVDAPDAPPPAAGAPGAAVSEALARGDLGAAAAAFDALPEEARRQAGAWGESLKRRAAAEAAAQALASDAVAALNQQAR